MHTLCAIALITSSPRIRNYADSDGETGTDGNIPLPQHIRTAHITVTQTTLTISGDRGSCNVPSGRFNVQFHLRHGYSTGGHNPQ
jgi:hypothetical protein